MQEGRAGQIVQLESCGSKHGLRIFAVPAAGSGCQPHLLLFRRWKLFRCNGQTRNCGRSLTDASAKDSNLQKLESRGAKHGGRVFAIPSFGSGRHPHLLGRAKQRFCTPARNRKTPQRRPFQSAYRGWSVPTKKRGYFEVHLSLSLLVFRRWELFRCKGHTHGCGRSLTDASAQHQILLHPTQIRKIATHRCQNT